MDKLTIKFGTFLLTILSGGALLYLGNADQPTYWSHIFGIFLGWCLWLYLAHKHGAKPDLFYSKTGNNNEETLSSSEKREQKYY